MRHVINKQILELNLDHTTDAFRMQHLVSEHYWKDLVPLLERVFNELSVEEETISIDHLEIDLGSLTPMEIEQTTWSKSYLQELAGHLKEQLLKAASSRSAFREAKAVSIGRQWLFYMQHGYLPWNAPAISQDWYNSVLEALATDYNSVAALRLLLQGDNRVLNRVVWQHEESFLVQLITILTAEEQSSLPEVVDDLQAGLYQLQVLVPAGSDSVNDPKALRHRIWQQLLLTATSAEKGFTTKRLLAMAGAAFIREAGISRVVTERLLQQFSATPASLRILVEQALAENNKALESAVRASLPNEGKESLQQAAPQESAQNSRDEETERASLTKDSLSTAGEEAENSQEPHEEVGFTSNTINVDGMFVQEAGIVLLHPFLSTFFSRIKLVAEKRFIHARARREALYLLHYMATGTTTAQEYELTMAKVLCNYPLQLPVARYPEPDNGHLQEAIHLLEAAIEQWETLKNTSVEGLRQGFLQRNGKLLVKNGGLCLQVETTSIDVLLDYLPWNLSIIKLPWMKEMLRVEWR